MELLKYGILKAGG